MTKLTLRLSLVVIIIFCRPAESSFGQTNQQTSEASQAKNNQSGEGSTPAQDRTEDEEQPKKPSAKSIQELNLPDPQLQEALQGKPRKRPEIFNNPGKIPCAVPETSELFLFREYRRPNQTKPITPQILETIDKVTKWQVLSFTDLSKAEQFPTMRKEIEKYLDQPQIADAEFMAVYKDLLKKYIPQLLQHHAWARVNGMILLAKLRDEPSGDLFVENLLQPDQHEVVKYWAVKGIMFLGEMGITNVELESRSIDAMMKSLEREQKYHQMTQWAIVRALGSLGRPRRSPVRSDAQVVYSLAMFIRDPSVRRLYRTDGVVSISKMKVPADLDYNFQLVAYEIAGFASEAILAALVDPVLDDLLTHYFLFECYKGLERVEVAAANHPSKGDVAYIQALRERVKAMASTSIDLYKHQGKSNESFGAKANRIRQGLPGSGLKEQMEEMNEFLKKNPPRAMKLTPDTAMKVHDTLPVLVQKEEKPKEEPKEQPVEEAQVSH